MSHLSIIGLFCEDIREEKGEVLTLVGLMPDNVNIAIHDGDSPPSAASLENRALSKLCIYVRANFSPDHELKTIDLNLVLPNATEIPVGGATTEVIETAKSQAKNLGLPLGGVVMRVILGGFRLPKPGILTLKASIDGDERVLAALNFRLDGNATSSTAH